MVGVNILKSGSVSCPLPLDPPSAIFAALFSHFYYAAAAVAAAAFGLLPLPQHAA